MNGNDRLQLRTSNLKSLGSSSLQSLSLSFRSSWGRGTCFKTRTKGKGLSPFTPCSDNM